MSEFRWLDEETKSKLLQEQETGMGYQVVSSAGGAEHWLVWVGLFGWRLKLQAGRRGEEYWTEEMLRLTKILKPVTSEFKEPEHDFVPISDDGPVSLTKPQVVTSLFQSPARRSKTGRTSGATPTIGRTALVMPIQVAVRTRLFYFSAQRNPSRLAGSTLPPGTYVTTQLDSQLVNTGFGAVGRYALPNPFPAIFRHEVELLRPVQALAGAVGPNFGQAGGGVELQLQASVTFQNFGNACLPSV